MLKRGLELVALLLTINLSGCGNNHSEPRQSSNGHIYLVPVESSLDFGTQWAQSKFAWPIEVQNTNDRPITLTGLATSCKCTVLSDALPLTFAPKGKQTLTLNLTLLPKSFEMRNDVNPFEVMIRPLIEDIDGNQGVWRLHGGVKSPLSISKSTVSFSNGIQFGENTVSDDIRINISEEVDLVEASCDQKYGKVFLDAVANLPKQYRLRVQLTDKLAPGHFKFTVTLLPKLKDHSELNAISVPVSGTVNYPVRIEPDYVELVSHHDEHFPSCMVRLAASDNTPFLVKSIEHDPNLLSVVKQESNGQGLVFKISRMSNSDTDALTVRFKVLADGNGESAPLTLRIAPTAAVVTTPSSTADVVNPADKNY